jgi:hypothetical protein
MSEGPQEQNEVHAMAWSAAGALFSAFVAALVIAFLDTDFGQEIASRLEGPGRALVAAPVIGMCIVIFCVSVLALVLPEQRRRLHNIGVLTAWLVVAWVVMAAVILAGLAYAVERVGG